MLDSQSNRMQAAVRILVVEDEEKLGRFICMLLGQMGYHAALCLRVDEPKRLLVQDQSTSSGTARRGDDGTLDRSRQSSYA
jgi:CheY-like chemotaxis protein